jgi:phosphohistidine phosphatase
MRVLIVRHAIAVEHGTPGIPDDERPLTPDGRRRFRKAAAGLARITRRPDLLLSSPLPRARQTAEIAARAWGQVQVTDEPALAGGEFEDVARVLDQHKDKRLVALVGHEPSMSAILARLLTARSPERLAFRKGGAALVDLPGAAADGGTLLWFLPPRVLRQL